LQLPSVDQVLHVEAQLFILVFAAFIVCHTHFALCWIFSVPENWPRTVSVLLGRWIVMLIQWISYRN
jgi:Na+/H+ antiporter NhaD/arsenite permease-like protein